MTCKRLYAVCLQVVPDGPRVVSLHRTKKGAVAQLDKDRTDDFEDSQRFFKMSQEEYDGRYTWTIVNLPLVMPVTDTVVKPPNAGTDLSLAFVAYREKYGPLAAYMGFESLRNVFCRALGDWGKDPNDFSIWVSQKPVPVIRKGKK